MEMDGWKYTCENCPYFDECNPYHIPCYKEED